MRRPHILKGLKQGLSNMRMIFFDVETTTINPTPKERPQQFRLLTANLAHYRKSGYFKIIEKLQTKNQEEFYLWFLSKLQKKQTLYVLSANIWFDIRTSGLFMFLMENNGKVKLFYSKGLTTIIKVIYGEYNIVFLNIQQFIPTSVERMGYMIGKYKLELNTSWWNDDDVMEYCQRDTDIITEAFRLWLDFILINDLGRFSFTMASQAFVAYRHRFMPKKIYIHAHKWITALERKCYYGGRTEIFYQGSLNNETIYNLDVNSMYAFIMRNHKMPVKVVKLLKLPSKTEIWWYSKRYIVLGWCAVNSDEPVYPKRMNKRLCFPIGKFTTYLTDPEIKYAIKNNHLHSIYYLVAYKADYIFTDFIDYFYDLRRKYKEDGNDTFDYMTKRIMNSLYGKFGQKIDILFFEDTLKEVEYSQETVIDEETLISYKELKLGKIRKVFKEGGGDASESFVAIPAHITGLARMYLWSLIKQAGRENVKYCDTDSIFVNQKGYDKLALHIDKNILGKLGLKGKSNNTIINCPKDYSFAGETTLKGVKKGVRPNKKGLYRTMQFPSFKGDLRAGLKKPYTIKMVDKHMKREYKKGEVQSDGTVKPFRLKDF